MFRIAMMVWIAVILQGCNIDSEYRALHAMGNDGERVWAFLQVNVQEEEDGVESYYYFAQISQTIYQGISRNELSEGFLLLENVRYWGNDDLIYDYKDIEYSGEIVFRIEDVQRISLINSEPVVGLGYEQYELQENAAHSEDAPVEDTGGEELPL